MILGFFGGTSVAALRGSAAKLASLRERFDGRVSQAIADRQNMISVALEEIADIKKLGGHD